MASFRTEQEGFWAGDFGDDYVDRNRKGQLLASNVALFSKVLAKAEAVKTVIEFGANIGMNLAALRVLVPDLELSAVEINRKAADELAGLSGIKIYRQSILDFTPDYRRDLVLVKGVLIHMAPDVLPKVYEILYHSAGRYICLAEYYNPSPVEVPYRGHKGRLFKRDFAGEMLDTFPDLRLREYGFVYRRDNVFPQDDITWFLLEKTESTNKRSAV